MYVVQLNHHAWTDGAGLMQLLGKTDGNEEKPRFYRGQIVKSARARTFRLNYIKHYLQESHSPQGRFLCTPRNICCQE